MRLHHVAAVVLANALTATVMLAQPGNVKDCLPALAKDYYSYAAQSSLVEDYLKTIDASSYEQLKQSNKADFTGITPAGLFSASDDYNSFNEKRNRYLEATHYQRSQQQALNILQITTSARAYPAYELCLQTIAAGPPLRVWASRESLNDFELRVKVMNPPGVPQMFLEGTIEGGNVKNASTGRLWNGKKKWKTNQEFRFVVRRETGVPTTVVNVAPDDGSPSVTLEFGRADGFLTLAYVGTTDSLRAKDRRSPGVGSPDNNNNRGNCPNYVGRSQGGYCISRTTAPMSTTAPHFFTNPRSDCTGYPCGWATKQPASITPDNLTVTGVVDNWGSPVTVSVIADEFEHVSAVQCGPESRVPVIRNKSVLLSSGADCQDIANIRWTLLDGSQGVFKFGAAKSAGGEVVRSGDVVTSGGVAQASYSLTK